ncbi:urease accessory protein UreD [Oculatella sp. LEGE 06141]|nr:urease accessory protein UreD [Oculatella sp. LEGE 06141]
MSNIATSRWHGTLQLEFAHSQDKTQLSRSYAQAPLKVQRPFYPEGEGVCHTVMLHTAGGIVGGDRLSVDIQLHPQAQALITTAAAAKVYRSNGAEATQSTAIHVASGACLEWLPQEAIVFDGARYRQELRVDLAADALWLGWDVARLGRSARGEQFLTGEWRSRIEVWQHNAPLWIDAQWLQGGSEMLTSPHGLAGYPVIGSFAIVGRSPSQDMVEKARQLWTDGNYHGEAGVTRLMAGLLCRYRGSSTAEVRRWFTQVWNLARLDLLQRPACSPRVWQR